MKRVVTCVLTLALVFLLVSPVTVMASPQGFASVTIVPIVDDNIPEIGDIVEFAVVLSSSAGSNLSAIALELYIPSAMRLVDYSLTPNISGILGMLLF